MMGIYALLVVAFGTMSLILVRESARVRSIDARIAAVARVLFVVSLAMALDSAYWAFAQSGRIGFLPPVVGQTLYRSKFIFIPKSGLLISIFVLWYLLRRREISELGKESEEGRRIRILHQITDSTTNSLDLAAMLQSTMPQMLELIGMQYAVIYVRNSATGTLELIGAFGETDDPYTVITDDERSTAVSVASEASNPTFPSAVTTKGGKNLSSTTVYIPMLSRDHSAGIVVMTSAQPRIFTQKDMDLLIAVGSQLAVAIDNALLFQQNQFLLAEAMMSANGLAKTVEERTQMLQQAQEELGVAELHKRQFYKDTVLAVTGGKLVIVEQEELPELGKIPIEICGLVGKEDIGKTRKVLRTIATEAGMPKNRVDNLLLATGEAMTNAVKHGLEGNVRIYREDSKITIAIEDHGPGIDALTLPKATLLRGYSTKPSLGMGYALILELADKVYLCTGPHGTIVVIEMSIAEPEEELTLDVIPDTWGQF